MGFEVVFRTLHGSFKFSNCLSKLRWFTVIFHSKTGGVLSGLNIE